MRCTLYLAIVAAFFSASASCSRRHHDKLVTRSTWSDTKLKEPTDFKAYRIGDLNSCPTLIQFKRDENDGRYDYRVTQTTSSGTTTLKQTIPYSSNQPLSVVDPTASGQRGVYKVSGGYTLTPFEVLSCPSDATYHVEAYDGTSKVWTSAGFPLTKKLVPLGAPGSTTAKSAGGSKVAVSWKYSESSSVQGYFVIAGVPSAKTISSTYVSGGSSTSATVDVGVTSVSDVAVTVNTFDGSVVGSPTNCEQVGVH